MTTPVFTLSFKDIPDEATGQNRHRCIIVCQSSGHPLQWIAVESSLWGESPEAKTVADFYQSITETVRRKLQMYGGNTGDPWTGKTEEGFPETVRPSAPVASDDYCAVCEGGTGNTNGFCIICGNDSWSHYAND